MKTVWLVRGYDKRFVMVFMMICVSEKYAKKIKKESKSRYKEILFTIEDWTVCGN